MNSYVPFVYSLAPLVLGQPCMLVRDVNYGHNYWEVLLIGAIYQSQQDVADKYLSD